MDDAQTGESAYERACLRNELCFEVDVHHSPAIILWQESLPFKVLQVDNITYIVRALSAEVPLHLINVKINESIVYGAAPVAHLVCREEVVIFHAALKGVEWSIMGHVIVSVAPGTYCVDSALQHNVDSSLIIHRLSALC